MGEGPERITPILFNEESQEVAIEERGQTEQMFLRYKTTYTQTRSLTAKSSLQFAGYTPLRIGKAQKKKKKPLNKFPFLGTDAAADDDEALLKSSRPLRDGFKFNSLEEIGCGGTTIGFCYLKAINLDSARVLKCSN